MTPIQTAFAAIDAANGSDPTTIDGRPAALVYGQRMTAELERLFPDASDILKIAARGQHIERWLLPRGDFPAGREGYLAWRREQARRHGERLGVIMRDAGYSVADAARVGTFLRKEGNRRGPHGPARRDENRDFRRGRLRLGQGRCRSLSGAGVVLAARQFRG